ncbi:MAG: hypothetical protein JSW34_01875 [Candidatus Zixiibacteriota bacterium]|nr:MAG: hypothetical protein JSW34_01875 [candidate division Zixibacteria bacterium]
MTTRILAIWTLTLILGGGPVHAQAAPDTVTSLPGIEIETSVDRAEMYVGDLITYKVTIKYDSTYELIPPPLGANLGAFDVKDYQSDILSRLPDGRRQSDNIFILSTFTTGDYVIPPIPVIFNLPDGSSKALMSEGVPIKVLSLLAAAGDSVDIKPLKAPYEFERDLTPYYFWGSVILALVLVALTIIWFRLRRRQEKRGPLDLRPAWEIAFEKLAFLKEKNLPQQGKHKEFYIELSEILRAYYESMYDLNVLDMTTTEFLEQFIGRDLPPGLYERTEDLLHCADLVKFAKHIPEIERTEEDFETTHWAVEEVRADYDRRLRPQHDITDIDAGDGVAAEEVPS